MTNGAKNTIERQTTGFLVDLTAPEMAFIGDGPVNGVDLRYQVMLHQAEFFHIQ